MRISRRPPLPVARLSICFFVHGFRIKKFSKTYLTLGAFSIIINLSITLVGNEIPREIRNPLADVVLSNIPKGNVSINPTPFLNFNNYPSITSCLILKTGPLISILSIWRVFIPQSNCQHYTIIMLLDNLGFRVAPLHEKIISINRTDNPGR